jgi:SAM-dependent methyltransferase
MTDQAGYVSFWGRVGGTLPSLKGAASTQYYFECERWLCGTYFPKLQGQSLFKTDLWDEAKNTEILRWLAQQGVRPYGVDIAFEIVRDARTVLAGHCPGLTVSDIRALPFQDDSFDLIYSMGTIEHFPDSNVAVREIFRVLKPGGTAIIGVPNKTDPFLRPLMVHLLNVLGAYAYGMERSFTARGLRRLLESAGFQVTAVSGILFIPGWLRMLDLLCYTRRPGLARITGALVAPFRWLYRHVPAVRRHGYLLSCVASKPSDVRSRAWPPSCAARSLAGCIRVWSCACRPHVRAAA